MPFSITGSKYASTTIASVGTALVNTAAAVFVSGDFTATRLLGLWDSAGTTFKGMAWARRVVTTSQVELQTAFFDPATGATATQVVGDIVLVSKNFLESVVAGLAVSGKAVTVTDQMTFGAAASNSVCFYDEGKEITQTSQTQMLGGLTVWGKLDSYSARTTSSACDYHTTIGGGSVSLVSTGAASNFIMYGGIVSGVNSPQYYGGYGGTTGRTMAFWNVQQPFDFISPGAGGSWGAGAARQQLINCYGITTAFNAIMARWGDGVISGGAYKFPNFTSGPISVFGNDGAGTSNVLAPPGTRAVVLDFGNGPALVRANATPTAVIYNFTNLITTDRRSVAGTSGGLVANTAGVNTFRFSDSYTSLQTGTVGVVLDSAAAVADSVLSSAATWSPSLLRATVTGVTQVVNSTSWTWGFKKYGFGVESGSIAVGTYDLGTAGTPENVPFGGPILQAVDPGTTLSNAAANALASVAHYSDLYDASVNWGTLSVANAQYPSLSAYPIIFSGTLLDLGAKNLILDNAAGTAFAINTGTNTLTAKAVALATTAKFSSVKTTGTITAAFAVGGAYTYVNGTLGGTTDVPTFTGGTLNIGAAGTYVLSTASTIVSMTPTAPSAYTFTGTHTGTLDLRNAAAHAITVTVPRGTTTTTASNVGGVITVQFPNVSIPITGLVAGSTIQLWNATDSVELYCAVVAGTSYTHSMQYVADKALRLRVTSVTGATAYTPYEATGQLTVNGGSFVVTQVANAIYNAWAINGSSQTQYTADIPNIDIDITAGGSYTKKSLAAWWMYYITSVTGIRNLWNAYTLESTTSIKQDISIINVLLQNTAPGTAVVFTDNDVRYYRSDFGIPYDTTPGFGSIFMDYAGVPVLPAGLASAAAAAVWNSPTAGYPTAGTFGLSASQTRTLAGLIPATL